MYNKMNWSGTFLHGVKFRFQKSTTLAKCRRSHFNVLSEKALSVVGYHDRGQEIGKYCPLPEPIRLQDSQDIARSRSKKIINDGYSHP